MIKVAVQKTNKDLQPTCSKELTELYELNKLPDDFVNYMRDKITSKENGLELWERFSGEQATRKKFNHFPQMTEELIISVIAATLTARMMDIKMKRNYNVTTSPTINTEGKLTCTICNNPSIFKAMALAPNREPEPGKEHVNFIFFICEEHAEDPDLLKSEIGMEGLLKRLLDNRDEMMKESNNKK